MFQSTTTELLRPKVGGDHRWALGPPTSGPPARRRAEFFPEVGGLKIFRRAGGRRAQIFPEGRRSEVSDFSGSRRLEGQKYMLNFQYSMLNRWAFGPPEGLLFAGGRRAGGRRAQIFPEGWRSEGSDFSGGPEVGGLRVFWK